MTKKSIRKCIYAVLVLCLVIIPSVNAYATQSRTENFVKGYSLGSDQAQNLVNVAQQQLGKSKASLGYTEAWCADFVCDCAKLTGMSDSIIPYNYASRGACTSLYNYMLKNCSAIPSFSPLSVSIQTYFTDSYIFELTAVPHFLYCILLKSSFLYWPPNTILVDNQIQVLFALQHHPMIKYHSNHKTALFLTY